MTALKTKLRLLITIFFFIVTIACLVLLSPSATSVFAITCPAGTVERVTDSDSWCESTGGTAASSGSRSYQVLEKLPGFSDTYTTASDFSSFLNSAFKVGIIVAVVLSVIMVVIGGIEYMGGDSAFNTEDAKKKWQGVAWGLILALGIYLLLNTINPDLVKLSLKINPVASSGPVTPPVKYETLPVEQSALDKILADEERMREELKRVGIIPNKNACTSVGQKNCTNVGLLGVTAVGGLQGLRLNCDKCSIMISGGTEWWLHSSHGPNKPIVDLIKDHGGALDRYIINNGKKSVSETFIKGRSIDVYNLDGGRFYSEDDAHWHVVF